MAQLYHLSPEDVSINCFDAANAIKVSLPRRYSCGSFYDPDCLAAQQHVPLADLELDFC